VFLKPWSHPFWNPIYINVYIGLAQTIYSIIIANNLINKYISEKGRDQGFVFSFSEKFSRIQNGHFLERKKCRIGLRQPNCVFETLVSPFSYIYHFSNLIYIVSKSI